MGPFMGPSIAVPVTGPDTGPPKYDLPLTYVSSSPLRCDRSFRATVQMSTFFSVRKCCTSMHIATYIELRSVPKLKARRKQ